MVRRIGVGLSVCSIVLSSVAAGCNTMRGVGKDIERGGEKIQETVDSVSKKD